MKNFISLILVTATFFASCSQNNDCVDEYKINQDDPCVEIYSPVCGCNNITYVNECYAERAGLTSWSNGECN